MSYHAKKSAGQRSTGLIFVVLLHILIIWGLANGLAHDAGALVQKIIQTKVVEEEKKVEEVIPPPPPPEKIPPPDFVPPPSIDFVPDAPAATNAIKAVQHELPKPAAPVEGKCEAAWAGKGPTRPDYPAASQRLVEEGTVEMNIYIGEDGRVADAQVTTSSGFDRLDTATINHAKRSWKFVPCIQGGKPTGFWAKKKLTWKLEDEKKH